MKEETDIIEIEEDEKGNIYRHETDMLAESDDGVHGKKSYKYENEQIIQSG